MKGLLQIVLMESSRIELSIKTLQQQLHRELIRLQPQGEDSGDTSENRLLLKQKLGEHGTDLVVDDTDFLENVYTRIQALMATGELPSGVLSLYMDMDMPKTAWSVEDTLKDYMNQIQKEGEVVLKQVEAAKQRGNVLVSIRVEPSVRLEDIFDALADERRLIGAYQIWVGTGGDVPYFTVFVDTKGKITEVHDIMEDATEIEASPEVIAGYYHLVKELQEPGSIQKQKWIKLYTARPVKDRELYKKATSLPHGIFLGNKEDHVEGLAGDLGGGSRRDVWYGIVDSRNLVQTLQGNIRYYMVIGKAALKEPMQLITPGN